MRYLSFTCLTAFLLTIQCNTTYAEDVSWELFLAAITGSKASTPSLKIIDPNGGEIFKRGDTTKILWESTDLSGDVTIEIYRTDTSEIIETMKSTVQTGSYPWTLSTSGPTGNVFRVRIVSDESKELIMDSSDGNFMINPPILPTGAVWYNDRVWQQSDDGLTYSWDEALTYCDKLTLDTFTDWYLPTKDELKELVACSNGTPTPLLDRGSGHPYHCGDNNAKPYDKPTIDTSVFSNQINSYWSADLEALTYYWNISFYSGESGYYPNTDGYYVRCIHP